MSNIPLPLKEKAAMVKIVAYLASTQLDDPAGIQLLVAKTGLTKLIRIVRFMVKYAKNNIPERQLLSLFQRYRHLDKIIDKIR